MIRESLVPGQPVRLEIHFLYLDHHKYLHSWGAHSWGQYIEEHGSINNSECRDLLLLGNSRSAHTTVSRLLASLVSLEPYGKLKTTRYRLIRETRK